MKTVAKARILVTRFPFKSRLGGEEVHTLRLMKELDKQGYEAFFLGSDKVLLKGFKKQGFETQKLWFSKPPVTKWRLFLFTLLSPFLFFWAGCQLKKMRKQWKIDIVYMLSFSEKLLMTFWAKRMGLKVVWVEHARIGRWLTKNPWRHVYRRLSKGVTTIVTSNAMKKFVTPYADHVEAISCGTMLVKEAPLRESIKSFLAGHFAVGSVARLTADKGVDKIVRLVHSKPDMRLVVVGGGPLKKRLESTVDAGQIMIVPSLPRGELMSFYKSLDVFILASTKFDPFGMVAAEAMAHGTPALITTVCGIAEDLSNGKNAMIVEPRFAALDKGLKILMKHPELREKLGVAGKQFVSTHYRLSDMVTSFEKVFSRPNASK